MFSRFKPLYTPVALALSIAFAGPAGAQTNESSETNSSCAQADSAMMSSLDRMKSAMPSSSGQLDKDFAAMMGLHENAMLDLARLEVRCGKSAKMKKAAQRFVQNAPRTHRFSGDSENL